MSAEDNRRVVQSIFGAFGRGDIPGAFIAEGDRVVVLGRERGRVKGTGKTFDNDWALVFTFGGGKVTGFQCYENTAAIAEAFS
jgi:uncharacterized protein